MKNVLVVKANNRPDGISTKMYDTFMETVKDNKNMNINVYDIFEEDMPYIGHELFSALGKIQNEEALDADEQRLMDAKQKAMDAFEAADVIVFAFPLWNLAIPARLQTFIDYVYSAGFTFKYNADGSMAQLMTDKKVILLNARGGMYSAPEMEGMDMSHNYMKNVIGGVFGMEIIDEVIIEGHNAMPQEAARIIEEGLESVRECARELNAQFA
ncbi:FMN-dependent NADH-azoreductase [Salinicoccus roseus]|uniref:FMN dependent NADH:quinone oxidoreductase n=1 Tax=Salinicoccus roseus TaxID=45670 RepID=A0A265E5V2_9STAP|nr:FMN-dependent NADH-azoreductase [Salinicoccus roseus]OZT76816.1 FMN-dependent NADH-azoreductase [Salinicoccus roseus]RPE51955.1 FMN-dependent NADH-azoreductase [Salinicoccus roseus]GGA74717.1 FMN-dependent NADH-azoreductase 1 [Salinicoccus roseus]